MLSSRNNMEENEVPVIEQTAEDKVDNEHSSGDSGIQICQQDEVPDSEEKMGDINGEEQNPEDNAILDEPEEDCATPDPSEEDCTATIPHEDDCIATNPPEDDCTATTPPEDENAMPIPSEDVNAETDDNTEDGQKDSKDNHLVTVELTVKEENDRYSPEIVVEPKFVDRLSSGKVTPQSFRVMTPKYYSPPQGHKLTPTLQITKQRSFCKQFKRCVLLVIFTVVVFAYAIGGAYLFSYLERKREVEYNAKIDKWKNDTAILLATELRQVIPYEDVWARKVFHYLEVFEKDLLKASSIGYRRQDDKDREQRWTWTSSLFFSITLMTTTGYGPMTPRSKLGRIATLFYSIFGIPLTLSWFMIIGYTLATFWASLFHNVCCRLCHESPPEKTQDVFPTEKHKKPFKLPTVRSNSIVPIEEQKLIVGTDSHLRHSAKVRQSMFPGDINNGFISRSNHYTKRPAKNVHCSACSMDQLETGFAELQTVYHKMDYAMAIIYASLFFVVYYLFFSILFALHEGWVLTDILYFSYLMFVTVGPGCHELADDGAEIKIKNDLFYTIHLCIGYCILAMILNLIYMLLQGKCDSEREPKWERFDSFQREEF